MKKSLQQFRFTKFTARKRALQFIYALDSRHDWAILDDEFENFREMALDIEEDSDREDDECLDKAYSYAETLARGVALEHEELDALITASASNWALKRISMIDRCLIRLASYEMKAIANVPPVTAINEAIELAKQFGEADSPRFVNGVLDRIRKILSPAEPVTASSESASAAQEAADADVPATDTPSDQKE